MPTTTVDVKNADWKKQFDEMPLPEFVAKLRKDAAVASDSAEITYKIDADGLTVKIVNLSMDKGNVSKTDTVTEIKVKES